MHKRNLPCCNISVVWLFLKRICSVKFLPISGVLAIHGWNKGNLKYYECLYARYVYFPVRNAGRGRIDRCNMDGTNCLTLISVNTSWPSGLTIDFDGQFYVIDPFFSLITLCRYLPYYLKTKPLCFTNTACNLKSVDQIGNKFGANFRCFILT